MADPTREQVERVRLMTEARGPNDKCAHAMLALCDLALRYLGAPERELTPSERAMWGTCPVCARKHGLMCLLDNGIMNLSSADCHPARLDAAPLRVRLVPADAESGGG